MGKIYHKHLLQNLKMKICFALFTALEVIHIIRCSSSEEREAVEESAFAEKVKRMLAGKEQKVIHSKITLILDKDTNWNKKQASDKCKNLGGFLVSLTSGRKADVLANVYSSSYYAWTSASKKNDIWKWGTGELLRPAVKRTWTYSASEPIYTAMIWRYGHSEVGYELWAVNPATASYKMACEVDGRRKPDRASLGSRTLMFMQSTFVFVRSKGINFTSAISECDKLGEKPGSAHLAAPTSFGLAQRETTTVTIISGLLPIQLQQTLGSGL